MPQPKKLKVYRTAIGFHDAYVAAPSQKAALAAWGTDRNLFARGAAEIVTDPTLTKAALARPGVVIKQSRGSVAEQIAALPKAKPPRRKAIADPPPPIDPKPPKARRPSRAPLDKAERAVEAVEERQRAEAQILAHKETELGRERRALEDRHAKALARLQRAREKAEAAYRKAVRNWNP